ncbi:Ff.00g133470.m01.CDS01 [Fusarium sp. VM40]|nr:Ff.00g133470.m01.CDS01 [Fusarium sp. VM40]
MSYSDSFSTTDYKGPVPTGEKISALIRRMRHCGYCITQWDLELIDSEQVQWHLQYNPTPFWDKKIQDARDAYKTQPDQNDDLSSRIVEETIPRIFEDNARVPIGQLRKLNATEKKAVKYSSQGYSGPMDNQLGMPSNDHSPFRVDPLTSAELDDNNDDDDEEDDDDNSVRSPDQSSEQEDILRIVASSDSGLVEVDYHLQVWELKEQPLINGPPEVMRKPKVPMRCFQTLARCSHLGYLFLERKRRGRPRQQMDNWHAHLSVGSDNRPPNNVPPKAVIVGYSGLSGHPVSARSPSDSLIEGPLVMSDSCSGIQFKTEPGNEPSGGSVIWHETLTVPDNISAIKRLVVSNARQFDSEKDLLGTIFHAHKRVTEGLSFDPPAHHKPETEGD